MANRALFFKRGFRDDLRNSKSLRVSVILLGTLVGTIMVEGLGEYTAEHHEESIRFP